MNRRRLLQSMGVLLAFPLLPSCSRASEPGARASGSVVVALNKPHEEWKGTISTEAFDVLFEEDTERPGSSPLNDEKRNGTFVCAACRLPLFLGINKYESGTGWPSFTQPIAGHIDTRSDFKLILPRTEYHCARCGGHQGHVFNDGPRPRGERWCNNGVALEFVVEGQPLPELRS